MGDSLTRLLLIALLLAVFFQGQTHNASGYSFQNPQLLENLSSLDSLPSAVQLSNGTIWVAWESYTTRTDAFYLTMASDGTSRSAIQSLTGPSTSYNRAPSLSQLGNGTIILVWSANRTGSYNLYYKTFTGRVWTMPVQLTSGSSDDNVPKTTVSLDGTLWVVWERDAISTLCPSLTCRQVFYKTLNGNTWSGDSQLTFDQTLNALPNVMVAKDGSIWVSWSKWISSGSLYNIYYQTFNGVTWSGQIPLTTVNISTFGDTHPDLIQDRNGTIWLFFTRETKVTTGIFQDKLFYKFSGDGGLSWSADTQLTFGGNSTNTIDDREPSTIQGRDHSLWIFYSSDATGFGSLFDIYYIKTNPIWPVHDVAVTRIQPLPVSMFPWNVAAVNVTVSDLGDLIENVQLTVQAVNKTTFTVGSGSTYLAGGTSKTFTFYWNASAASPGRYTIVASAPLVPGETIGAGMDNTLRYKTLNILYPGDLNKDGRVTIIDAGMMGAAFYSRPGYPNWNPDADIDHDGFVSIIDFGILAANYGKSI